MLWFRQNCNPLKVSLGISNPLFSTVGLQITVELEKTKKAQLPFDLTLRFSFQSTD